MGYAEWFATKGPPWLRDPIGQGEANATGAQLDYQRDRALQGVLARFPTRGRLDSDPASPTFGQYFTAPTDALDELGSDRVLPRAVAESDANFAPRLKDAWTTHSFDGSHYAVLRQLALQGYVGPIIVQDNGRWARLTGSAGTIADMTQGSLMACINRSSHPGWTFDDRTDYYPRFGIVFEADAANLSSASGQAQLNAIVKQWGPGKATFVASFVILAGRIFGWTTGISFGTAPNLGGNSVRWIPGDGSAPFVEGP